LLAEIYLATVYVNQRKREIKKKTWVPNRGQAKIWWGHGPPRPSLEPPLGYTSYIKHCTTTIMG